MRAVVVYESMYGNTHLIADAIGSGLRDGYDDVVVLPVEEATNGVVGDADLVVVGGPTHAHGMSRAATRKAAVDAARKPDSDLRVDEVAAGGPGVREWLQSLGAVKAKAAAFDTRIRMAAILTGQASRGISKALRAHGAKEVVPPESFFVTKESTLDAGEEDRAREWGKQLAAHA